MAQQLMDRTRTPTAPVNRSMPVERPEANAFQAEDGSDSGQERRPVYRIFGREFKKPGSPAVRYALAVGLICGGFLGFLPILGFWMLPLGLLILSHELHILRRVRRRWAVRNGRRKARRAGGATNGN